MQYTQWSSTSHSAHEPTLRRYCNRSGPRWSLFSGANCYRSVGCDYRKTPFRRHLREYRVSPTKSWIASARMTCDLRRRRESGRIGACKVRATRIACREFNDERSVGTRDPAITASRGIRQYFGAIDSAARPCFSVHGSRRVTAIRDP